MSALAELQAQFQDFLLHTNINIESFIEVSDKVPTKTRLGIYYHAYRARLIEALASNYPILAAYLGEEGFETLAYHYLDSHPSTFPSIRWFGDQLSTVIREVAPYCHEGHLGELAQIEWIMTLVFDANDTTTLTIEDMSTIPPDAWADMRFEPHPSLHHLNLCWNSMGIWQALADEETPPQPILGSPVPWIYWRSELINQFCSVSQEESWAILAMHNHATFGEICEGLCQWVQEEEAPTRAASLLRNWIEAGLIAHVIL